MKDALEHVPRVMSLTDAAAAIIFVAVLTRRDAQNVQSP